MTSLLETYHNILFLELRPWLQRDASELKFKQDLIGMPKENYQFQPLYELSFPKALTFKRKYYLALIDNQAIAFLNSLHICVSEAPVENSKRYHVHMALTRTLSALLSDISRVIKERQYTPAQYDPKFDKLPDDPQLSDEAFILDYLKHSVVRLFLEIQDTYPDLLKNEKLEEADIYLKFFNQNAPSPSFFVEAERIVAPNAVIPIDKKENKTPFKPFAYDFKDTPKGILPYETIIKTPPRFTLFEEKLFDQGYINNKYEFVNNHGQKNELAMIYHHLINKGYFNKRRFPGNREIKDQDIRKFLDHRYKADIDKQFRNYRKEPEKIAEFVGTHYWLHNLPLG
jgi:hypothetical protein